jgi:hypothetical protein
MTEDYADIPDRIRRTGRFDIEDVWLPSSGDGWQAFRTRHGDYGFDWDYKEWERRLRDGYAASSDAAIARRAEQAARMQAAWEEAQRQRQQAKQQQADAEWTWTAAEQHQRQQQQAATEAADLAVAREYWGEINAAYAAMQYRSVTIGNTGTIHGVTLYAGKTYWLPLHLIEWLMTYGYGAERAA